MNKIIITIFILASIFTVSCDKDPQATEQNPLGSISFSGSNGSLESSSRIGYNPGADNIILVWQIADNIGIFARSESGAVANNYEYTATPLISDKSLCTFLPADQNNMLEWLSADKHSFYAYYPYTGKAGEGDPAAYPLQLPEYQRQVAAGDANHLGDINFMKATATGIPSYGGSTGIRFTFQNVFAIIELKIKLSSSASENISINRVSMTSTEQDLSFSEGYIDLTTPLVLGGNIPYTITNGNKSIILGLASAAELNNKSTQSFFMGVATGTHSDNAITVTVTTTYGKQFIQNMPGVTFNSNMRYAREVIIDPANLQ